METKAPSAFWYDEGRDSLFLASIMYKKYVDSSSDSNDADGQTRRNNPPPLFALKYFYPIAHFLLMNGYAKTNDGSNDAEELARRVVACDAATFHREIERLFDASSDFGQITPRSLGVDLNSMFSSQSIQQSLNVKRFVSSNVATEIDPETNVYDTTTYGLRLGRSPFVSLPVFKNDMLHSDPAYVWIRFYDRGEPQASRDSLSKSLSLTTLSIAALVDLGQNYFELYLEKKNGSWTENLDEALDALDARRESVRLLFCSELSHFRNNVQLFVSNATVFTYCYETKNLSLSIGGYSEEKSFFNILLRTFYFLESHNLTKTPSALLNPLQVCMNQRPTQQMKTVPTKRLYAIDGSKPSMANNGHSDMGLKSNFIEITTDVVLAPIHH